MSIPQEDIANYTVEIEKPTYHISGTSFPSVVALLMQMKHASELSAAKAQEGINEWNKDIIEESAKAEFGKDAEKEEAKEQAEKVEQLIDAPFDEKILE